MQDPSLEKISAQLEAFVVATKRTQRLQTGLLFACFSMLVLWSAASIWLTYKANAAFSAQETVQPARHILEPEEASKYNGFHAWPVAKKMAAASVVFVTRPVPSGEAGRDVIAEVIKQDPEARFPYKVGDMVPESWASRPEPLTSGSSSQDGWLIFMVGLSPRLQYATTLQINEQSPIYSLEQMTLGQLRELAAAPSEAHGS